MLPNVVWNVLIMQPSHLAQIVRVNFEPSLTIRALHLQETEIFLFLRNTAILASLCELRSGGLTTAMPLPPCHPCELPAMGILAAVL